MITKGTTPTTLGHDFTSKGIPFVRVQNIEGGSVTLTRDTLFIDENTHRILGRSQIHPGDVLVSIAGTIGRASVVPDDAPPLNCNQAVAIVRARNDVHRPFLRHWLETSEAQTQMRGATVTGTISNLSLTQLGNLRVPFPPLPEQRRVAEVLDRADALRAKRRAALAQLDTLTQAIFLDMFGDPIENSRRFPIRRMIELVDPARPISYGILMPGPDQMEGVKYVRVVDMQDGGIELSGIRRTTEAISNSYRRSLLKSGDLLMSIRGHVGRLAVVPPELDGANITQDTARLAVVDADPVFVRECLRTEAFQRWMATHTKGVAVRGINLADVKLMPIIAPELSKQREFAQRASAAGRLRSSECAALAELDALFASLQHRAFRGEL